ncbi:MAG: alpha/beta hydrolase [bacterium]|nr:alpha/beta hydrolase [bacterium]
MIRKDEMIVEPYIFNGLRGRKAYSPAQNRSSKNFLIVYGQHVSIERLEPMIKFLSNYGNVYLFDNPGFGNMEPSYKLGKPPTLDFYSDHIKNIFDNELPKDKKFHIVAISFGMQVVTHFLQKHPKYQKRVDIVISFVGFIHHKELSIPRSINWLLKYVLGGFGKTLPGSLIYRYILLQPVFLIPIYLSLTPFDKQLVGKPLRKKWQYAVEQSWLWKYNDPRTHAFTAWQFITHTDLTNKSVGLDCHHVYAAKDQYIDNDMVTSNLKKVFDHVETHALNLPAHSPIDIEAEYKIAELLPKKVIDIIES